MQPRSSDQSAYLSALRSDPDGWFALHQRALRHQARLDRLSEFLTRLQLKYDDSQPRWPEGHPLGGQWKPKEAGEGEEASTVGEESFGFAPDGTPVDGIGGISPSEQSWTVQKFMSVHCEANIRSVMPGQFLPLSIAEVMVLAKNGDVAARRCLKLLGQDRFRK